jgi:hypothetical protein
MGQSGRRSQLSARKKCRLPFPNSRSVAEVANAERDRRIDAAQKAKDEAGIEKENVARLKKERDEALAKPKPTAAAPGADGRPQFDLRNAMGGFAKAFDDSEQRTSGSGFGRDFNSRGDFGMRWGEF